MAFVGRKSWCGSGGRFEFGKALVDRVFKVREAIGECVVCDIGVSA